VLGGALGARLDEADRQAALNAQAQALTAGKRQSWRGAHGAFGFAEPGAPQTSAGDCRAYTQTIYLNGRPQSGHGLACRQADGGWRMAD
jgi:surface antigen